MSDTTATPDLAERARAAAWGLAKGGHLDALDDAPREVLLERWDILDQAADAGITINLEAEGIGEIYSREFLEGLTDYTPRSPDTGRRVR